MKTYTQVSRKTLEEDRIAICPTFGCKSIKRVKPLKIRFIGFGKNPKLGFCGNYLLRSQTHYHKAQKYY